MALTKQQIDKLADYLRGTSHSLDEGLAAVGLCELAVEDCEVFDASIFECDQCGWWYEISELGTNAESRLCTECSQPEAQ